MFEPSPLEIEFAQDESKYEFSILVTDPVSRKRRRFRFRYLCAPWITLRLAGVDQSPGLQSWRPYAAEMRLLRSSLFGELSKKKRTVAEWLCASAIFQALREPPLIFVLPPKELHRLHGMRRKAEKMIREIEAMIKDVKRMEGYSLLHDLDLIAHLEPTVRSLRKFEHSARQEPSKTRLLKFEKHRLRPFWMFRLPAISYALFQLLTEDSTSRIRAGEAYRRIGIFERECLSRKGRNPEADVEDTVRRQVYTFKRSDKREEMDRLLKRLIVAEWNGLDHPMNCDWETPKALPRSSR